MNVGNLIVTKNYKQDFSIKCPVCTTESFSAWGRVDIYNIERCQGCGLGITSPFPEQKQLVAINQETYLLEQRITTYRSRYEYFKKRYQRQLHDIKSFKPSGKLLDIGCNIGVFLSEARAASFETTGIELNRECAEYAQSHFNLSVHSDYLDNIAFEADSFDVVTMYDVLEHIPDLHSMLAEIRRVLKPGGLLVVQSPNLDSLMADLSKSAWGWLSPPDHLYHFTPGALSSLLVQTGYDVQLVKTWEPADDFCADVMQAKLGNSLLARITRKLIRLSGLALALVTVVQKNWWTRQKGALVEVYAVKATISCTLSSSTTDKGRSNDL